MNGDDGMTKKLQILRTVAEMRAVVQGWRAQGLRVALVPTMGALHEGHLALVRLGLEKADRVIATIFVNPKQFGAGEDLARYPRQEAQDAAALEASGCDLLFVPGVEEIYPHGFATSIHVAGVTQGLCGAARPGHFDGVATVVAKLLNMAGADIAIFGEKDYQQLRTIERLAADLNIPTKILGAPIVRDADGLALSSRNAYLHANERLQAPALPKALRDAVAALEEGGDIAATLAGAEKQILAAGFSKIDYLELRDAQNLEAVTVLEKPARLLVAAHLGTTRLIDNMAVQPSARR